MHKAYCAQHIVANGLLLIQAMSPLVHIPHLIQSGLALTRGVPIAHALHVHAATDFGMTHAL